MKTWYTTCIFYSPTPLHNMMRSCFSADMFLAYILFLVKIALCQAPASPCPNQCQCVNFNTGLSVSCGPGLTSFPRNVPANTHAFSTGISSLGLQSHSNNIPSLSNVDFSTFQNVVRIKVAFSNVQTILPGTFSQLSNLDQLNLKGNKIARLSRSVFVGLTRLRTLNLADNKGCLLDVDVFKDLTSLITLELSSLGLHSLGNLLTNLGTLMTLDLHGNDIVRLESSSFSNLKSLRHLDVSFNDLYEVQKGLKPLLSSLSSLNLENNPWRCNCAMIWLKLLPAKFVAPWRGSRNGLVCDAPSKFTFLDLANVRDINMTCEPPKVSCNSISVLQEGQPISIFCHINGDPFPDVIISRPDGTAVHTTLMRSTSQAVNITIAASVFAKHNGQWSIVATNVNGSASSPLTISIATTTKNPTTTTTTATTTKTPISATIFSSPSSQTLPLTKQPPQSTPSIPYSAKPGPQPNHSVKPNPSKTTAILVSQSPHPLPSLPAKPATTNPQSTPRRNNQFSTKPPSPPVFSPPHALSSINVVFLVEAAMCCAVFLVGVGIFAAVVYKSKRKVRIAAKRRSVYSRTDETRFSKRTHDTPFPVTPIKDIIYFRE